MLNKMDNQRVNNAKSGPVLYLVRDQACPGGHSIIYLHQWQSLTHHHQHSEEKDQDQEMALGPGAKQASGVFVREAQNGPEMD